MPAGYFQNQRKLGDYQRAVDAEGLATERGVRRTPDDIVRGEIIRTLMCRGGLDLPALERRFELRFAEVFEPELAALRRLESDGLVQLDLDGGRVALTPLGEVFVRNVARVFDAYRGGERARAGAPVRFSSTV